LVTGGTSFAALSEAVKTIGPVLGEGVVGVVVSSLHAAAIRSIAAIAASRVIGPSFEGSFSSTLPSLGAGRDRGVAADCVKTFRVV
jgi:hypothetical protein